MAFNPDEYLAKKKDQGSGFDPDRYLASKAKEAPPSADEIALSRAFGAPINEPTNPKAGEAMLQGFGNQAALGYLPQLQGMAEVMGPNPTKDLDEELRSKGFKIDQPKNEPTYLQARDAALSRQEELQKAAPGSYLSGQLGGAVAGGAGLGLLGKGLGAIGRGVGVLSNVAKPAGFLTNLGKATLAGAAQGGLQNPGDIEGKITGLQENERRNNLLTGAALGAGGFGVASAVGGIANAISKAPLAARYLANLKALKSAGIKPKDFEQIEKRGNVDKIGQAMIDKGLVSPGSTFEDVAKKSGELREEAGQKLGSLYDEIQSEISDPNRLNNISGDKVSKVLETRMDPYKFADDIEKSFNNTLVGKSGATQARSIIKDRLDELRENGSSRNIQTIQDFKSGLDDMIKWDHDLNKMPLAKQYLVKMRNELKNKIEEHVNALDSALGKDRITPLKEANDAYGTWSTIHTASSNKVARESMNRFASLTDTIAGAGGAGYGLQEGYRREGIPGAIKGAALGAGLGLVNKGARLYGNPILTQGLNKFGGAIGSIPAVLPKSIGAGAGLLAQNPMISGAASVGLLQQPQQFQPPKVKP